MTTNEDEVMLSRFRSAIQQRPLPVFIILAYVLSWWMWPLYAAGLAPLPIASFGPCLAAFAVLALTRGRGGVVVLLRQMVRWRLAPRWYAAAFLIPASVATTATGLNVLLGAQAPSSTALANWPSILPGFLIALLIPGLGGAWEEPGRRGYALPGFLTRHTAGLASLL